MGPVLSILLAVIPPVPTRTEAVVEKIHGITLNGLGTTSDWIHRKTIHGDTAACS